MRRRDAVKSPLNEFPDWTTTHGIGQIARIAGLENKTRSKWACLGYWTVVTVACLGLLIWSLAVIFTRFYRYEVTLRSQQRVFPAVTICDLNPYKKSVVSATYPNAARLMDTYMYVMMKVACKNTTECYTEDPTMNEYQNMYGLNNITDTAMLQTRAKKLLKLEISQYEYNESLISLEEIVQSCSFNTEKCDMDIDWDSYVDPVMGQCFLFNKGSHRTSDRAGPYYGLRVVLKSNVSDYLLTSDVAGMRVMVHDQGEWPFPDIFGYTIRFGAATGLAVIYQESNRLGHPYSDCTDAKPAGYLYDLDYSTVGCQRSQFQQLMIDACGCYDPSFPPPSDASVPMCGVEKNFECWNSQVKNLKPKSTNCPLPCRGNDYKGKVSSTQWPRGPLKTLGHCNDVKNNETCRTAYQNSGALLEVYYEKLNYNTMDESPAYGSSNLLSDFGAQTGLWLGLSVISFVEFVVLIFQVCLGCCHPKAGEVVAF
ncbi:Protein DEL-4 [Aphelenchoides avenae]|nr:Protein DEL-4 [Aphelenchus avenae]